MELRDTRLKKLNLIIPTAILFLIYVPVLLDLVENWYMDANYSHGFLIPIISGYLIWRKRESLFNTKTSSSTFGLWIVALAMLVFIIGNAASEYFTVRLSLVLAIFGVVLYMLGEEIVKKSWFEIAFLLFMIPIPYVVYFSATFPMQILASKVTVVLLDILGMPVIRQGNIIHLPNQSLEVVEACSGLRSLVSLLAMGAIFAYATQKRFTAKIILFLSTIPIAILGNVFRVFITSLLVYTADVNVTDEPLHSIMGALVFVIALILLFIFGGILKRVFR